MNIEMYREFVDEHIERLQRIDIEFGKPTFHMRDFTNEELQIYVDTRLSNRVREAVYYRFTDPKPTYKEVGQKMGIRATSVRDLCEKSISGILKPWGGFRRM